MAQSTRSTELDRDTGHISVGPPDRADAGRHPASATQRTATVERSEGDVDVDLIDQVEIDLTDDGDLDARVETADAVVYDDRVYDDHVDIDLVAEEHRGDTLVDDAIAIIPDGRLRYDGPRVHAKPASLGYRIAKRGLDLVLGLTGLVLFSPLIAVLSLATRLESKGPAFFAGSGDFDLPSQPSTVEDRTLDDQSRHHCLQ